MVKNGDMWHPTKGCLRLPCGRRVLYLQYYGGKRFFLCRAVAIGRKYGSRQREQRMPETSRAVLVANPELELDALAELADNVVEAARTAGAVCATAAAQPTLTTDSASLQECISQLAEQNAWSGAALRSRRACDGQGSVECAGCVALRAARPLAEQARQAARRHPQEPPREAPPSRRRGQERPRR